MFCVFAGPWFWPWPWPWTCIVLGLYWAVGRVDATGGRGSYSGLAESLGSIARTLQTALLPAFEVCACVVVYLCVYLSVGASVCICVFICL